MRRCRLTGLAGSVALAAGGVSAGALPAGLMLAPDSGAAAFGLAAAYFGLVLLTTSWALLGRAVRGPSPPGPRELLATLVLWAAPLLVAPPLFSRDVYSYVAQGAMVDAHLDVYTHGPSRLGGPLLTEVAPLWRDTPAPYGPVFLALASAVTGDGARAVSVADIAGGALGMRFVALCGVALMTYCLLRLARHCGTDPSAALWLGALNPLVLLHLVGGAHNDAVMLGLLGAGLLASLGGGHLTGTVLITLAALVKAPAALGLLAVVVLWARRTPRPGAREAGGPRAGSTEVRAAALRARGTGGPVAALRAQGPGGPVAALRARAPRTVAALAVTAAAAATTAVTTAAVGTGYGWLRTLDTPASPGNWALTSSLGRISITLLAAAGDGPAALARHAVPVWHLLGIAATAVAVVLAWRRHHRLRPVHAVGLSLLAVALLGPAIRPWYVLWGLFLIAATGPGRRLRRCAAVASAVLALTVPPSGFAPGGAQSALACGGGLLAAAAVWRAHRPPRPSADLPVGSTA
ncbi:polyprenol phosphomannose-dependent alpha 1,6 mannosyltransferase MptB [Streptomyces zhihengii]|uniref:polyprenol phosphomannose-dependent alpha 1,6 mannosyltransferase MptB n=1 Tax=Streptomyces zhihengii TaxID=1818004 RepID=UPI0033B09E0B